MSRSATVGEYMTPEVQTVDPMDSVRTVAEMIKHSDGHNGFPVAEGRRVVGFVTASDLLLVDDEAAVFTVMTEDIIVAHPEMRVTDAARVVLRSGIQKLPVVDDADNLVGIISNTDVVRSQIERATPQKVGKLMQTLEQIHDITVRQERREVLIDAMIPTQARVYADELEGRRYELERGLAEPLVAIDCVDGLLLADGHHRALAAERLGIDQMDAYVIVVEDPVELGMYRTAKAEGLSGINDIEVVDYARHPLIERTHRITGERS
jgi:Predicted transcriptional regulator, contains C-terminal CBS domains